MRLKFYLEACFETQAGEVDDSIAEVIFQRLCRCVFPDIELRV